MAEPEKKSRSCLGRVLKLGLLLIVLIVATVLVVGFFVLDGHYDVARETTIKASPEAIHKQVGDLEQWPNWLPFTKHDKSIEVTIGQPTGVGANQHWKGKSGSGELKFTEDDPKTGIEFDMVFDEKYKSRGSIRYVPSGDETTVAWRMTGQNDDFVGRWFALLTPYMVGPMFEEGLADLKKKVETP